MTRRQKGAVLVSVTIALTLLAMILLHSKQDRSHDAIGQTVDGRVVEKVKVYPVNHIDNMYVITCKSAITGDVHDIHYSKEAVVYSEYDDEFWYWDWKTEEKEILMTVNRTCSYKPPVNLVVEAE